MQLGQKNSMKSKFSNLNHTKQVILELNIYSYYTIIIHLTHIAMFKIHIAWLVFFMASDLSF